MSDTADGIQESQIIYEQCIAQSDPIRNLKAPDVYPDRFSALVEAAEDDLEAEFFVKRDTRRVVLADALSTN